MNSLVAGVENVHYHLSCSSKVCSLSEIFPHWALSQLLCSQNRNKIICQHTYWMRGSKEEFWNTYFIKLERHYIKAKWRTEGWREGSISPFRTKVGYSSQKTILHLFNSSLTLFSTPHIKCLMFNLINIRVKPVRTITGPRSLSSTLLKPLSPRPTAVITMPPATSIKPEYNKMWQNVPSSGNSFGGTE